MTESFGITFKNLLIENKILRAESFKGCSPETINTIMVKQSVKRLPRVYYDFLLIQGKAGLGRNFYLGSSWSCETLKYLKDDLIDNTKRYDSDFSLPEDAFVYFGHQDYEFQYFLTDNDNDDPPNYRYVVGHGEAIMIRESLTEYYKGIIEHMTSRR